MEQEPEQAAACADVSSEHVENSDPFSLIESVPASPARDAASERSWDFSEWVRGQADRPSLGEPSELDRESRAPVGAETEAGFLPSHASSRPAGELPGVSYNRMSYERLLNASHMSLDREVPKLFWQEGFWAEIFNTEVPLIPAPSFPRLAQPPNFGNASSAGVGAPDPKRARKLTTCIFEKVVIDMRVFSWREQREADLCRAFAKWCSVFADWDSSQVVVAKQLSECDTQDACHELLSDYLARKAPSTCVKRANSMLRLNKYAASEKLRMPIPEAELYHLLRSGKAGGASLSELRCIMEALTFVRFTFDVECLQGCAPRTMELVAVGRGLDGSDWLGTFVGVRKLLECEYAKDFPSMPAPNKQGLPTVRALSSAEAGAWLRELLPERGSLRTTSHSLKSTLLSFAAKRGIAHLDRLALGGHSHSAHMSDVYARDALARPLRLLAGMLTEIRQGTFVPDAGRAARFPGRFNEADLRAEVPEAIIQPVVDVDLTSEAELKARESEAEDTLDAPSIAGPSPATPVKLESACVSAGEAAACSSIDDVDPGDGTSAAGDTSSGPESLWPSGGAPVCSFHLVFHVKNGKKSPRILRISSCHVGNLKLYDLLFDVGIKTHFSLAFACGTPRAQPTDAEFTSFANTVVGVPASIGQVSSLKRLHFESSTLVVAALRTMVEGDAGETGKKFPVAEKAARLAEARRRLPGLVIEDELEPSHALLDIISHMGEANAVVWVPPSKCTKRDDELKLGLRDKQKYLTVQEHGVMLAPAPDKLVAEHGSPLEVQWWLQRRGMAFFMCGFMSYETHERWVSTLLRALSSDVPPGYAPISVAQIMRADSEMFLLLAKEVHRVKPDDSGVMEMDEKMKLFRHDPRVTSYLQPLQKATSSVAPPPTVPGDPSGAPKGKGRGKKGKDKNEAQKE
ncbi:hypothetical protein AK812_SmicGene45867 [Symbiodinium microadriaticum]|uniref:Uncharacterized protein n=1 Tax=Symbiodinium microadriaticum TaxID=2951 RepID=A0A1Q9BV71_SYMMI|nr:hypothetical protein AK812_SmicGene45867 [Symbiodinium microadriaticum]